VQLWTEFLLGSIAMIIYVHGDERTVIVSCMQHQKVLCGMYFQSHPLLTKVDKKHWTQDSCRKTCIFCEAFPVYQNLDYLSRFAKSLKCSPPDRCTAYMYMLTIAACASCQV